MEKTKISQFKERLIPLYSHMIQVTKDSGENYDTAKFCMQWGKDFPVKENDGLLFYGRANNGWVSPSNDVDELFADGCDESIFNRANQMEWMEEDIVDDHYKPSVSAFIRMIRNISSNYYEDWSKHVAWSNLYKIAPWEGGNPNNTLCYAQLEDCKKIMKEELSFVSPRVVMMLTGYGWAKDFLKYLNDGMEPDCVDKEAWDDYEAWTYKIGGRLFIVSEHPRSKKEMPHTDAIVKLIERNVNH